MFQRIHPSQSQHINHHGIGGGTTPNKGNATGARKLCDGVHHQEVIAEFQLSDNGQLLLQALCHRFWNHLPITPLRPSTHQRLQHCGRISALCLRPARHAKNTQFHCYRAGFRQRTTFTQQFNFTMMPRGHSRSAQQQCVGRRHLRRIQTRQHRFLSDGPQQAMQGVIFAPQ